MSGSFRNLVKAFPAERTCWEAEAVAPCNELPQLNLKRSILWEPRCLIFSRKLQLRKKSHQHSRSWYRSDEPTYLKMSGSEMFPFLLVGIKLVTDGALVAGRSFGTAVTPVLPARRRGRLLLLRALILDRRLGEGRGLEIQPDGRGRLLCCLRPTGDAVDFGQLSVAVGRRQLDIRNDIASGDLEDGFGRRHGRWRRRGRELSRTLAQNHRLVIVCIHGDRPWLRITAFL